MNKEKIKESIYFYELNSSGLRKINGGAVKVVNLKIRKREQRVYADIILIRLGDGDNYITERYSNCYYSFELLGIK